MRALLLLLLLANVAWFAWTRFMPQQSPEAQLMAQQLNRDAIRLLGPKEAAAQQAADAGNGTTGGSNAAAAGPSATTSATAAGAPTSAAALPPSPVAASTPGAASAKAAACLEWGAIGAADVSRAEQALAGLALGNRLSQRRSDDNASWWVFIAPMATRQAAVQRALELRKQGVDELFVMGDEAKARFAISLGVFRSEEAARKRLDELRAQGVRGAQSGQRDTPVQRVYFQVHDVSAALRAKLEDARQSLGVGDIRECTSATAKASP